MSRVIEALHELEAALVAFEDDRDEEALLAAMADARNTVAWEWEIAPRAIDELAARLQGRPA